MWCPVSAYMNALCVCRYRQAAAAAVDSTTARERAAASTALRAEEERRQAAERSAEESAAKAEQGALAIKQMLAVLSAAVRQPATGTFEPLAATLHLCRLDLSKRVCSGHPDLVPLLATGAESGAVGV